jgi:hypothetical protein
MRILSARIHGYLDFALVAIFAVVPLIVGLGGSPLLIAWLLAAALLLLTLATRFPLGIWRAIPFPVHGLIELAIAVFCVSLPFSAGYAPGSPARRFYVTMAALVFLVWVLTDYKREDGLQSAP